MDTREKSARVASLLDQRTTIQPPEIPGRRRGIKSNPWKSLFRNFDQQHLEEAFENFIILFQATDFDDFLKASEEVRASVSDDMFLFILYSALLHRSDTRDVKIPAVEEVAPHWFFASETIHEAIQLSIHHPDEDHTVVNQKTSETSEPESRLAYFREDVGMNIHHWAWHAVYPVIWDDEKTGKVKDRKGELFYYMHQQMTARYDCERLSNGMSRVIPLRNFREKLPGYSPHLTSQTTGVHFGYRPREMQLQDLADVSVRDLELWRLRILNAIDEGFVRDINHDKVPIDNKRGIDILGALVEASSDSVNRQFYGNLHNMGHTLLANIHDPDDRLREFQGVMDFTKTAARDPIFYRWHKYMDDIFQRHKATLGPYTREELNFEGIRIETVEIKAKQTNIIETSMIQARADLSSAPFLRTKRKIWVTYDQLDHEAFSYVINIRNETQTTKQATVRVFLGPKYDENGAEFELGELRRLMIELDKFQVDLTSESNVVRRHSTQSSVTLKRRSNSFPNVKEGDIDPQLDYCSCGWPDHLLVPRGSERGTDFVLFVMCTDYNDDRVDQGPNATTDSCRSAVSYCGSKDQKYPDKKPMGYPFDRPIWGEAADFFTNNMIVRDVKINFMGRNTIE